jgi:hypothetical protein
MEKHCTIVSAYYKMKSKLNHNIYMNWITNFLSKVNCHLIFYTSSECYETFKNLREPFLEKTKFIVKEFNTLTYSDDKYKEIWEYNYCIDSEKNHSKELYIIWNEKTKFVMDAIKLNPFNSTHFFWIDAGAFRDLSLVYELKKFPNAEKFVDNKITLLEIDPISAEDYYVKYPNMFGPLGNELKTRIGGGIFGGDINAWTKWNEKYDEIILRHNNDKLFAGKDQNLMFYILIENPDLINLVKHNTYRDKWFYLIEYLNS